MKALLIDADLAAFLAQGLELHDAVDLGVDGPVAADADVLAGVDPGAALADDDGAGVHLLSGESLDAAALAVAVAAVGGAAAAFFCSH